MFIKMHYSEATLIQMKALRILKAVDRLKNEKRNLNQREYNLRLEALKEDATEIKTIMSDARNDKIIMIES